MTATLTPSVPANTTHFAAGEQIRFAISVTDRCGRPASPGALSTFALYLAGPRASALTTTASKLLNCVTNRTATDRQHHFVNLKAPSFAAPAQNNLSGTGTSLVFTTAAVSTEPPGTYTAGLWLKSADDTDQQLVLADVQLGTPTLESPSTGNPASCDACHRGPSSGKVGMAHSFPGWTPLGNFAIDQAPVVGCKLCHNADGVSSSTVVRKVHAVHRGGRQTQPGVAHPEYGAPSDLTLGSYLDVSYPSLPGRERDCASCHVTTSYLTAPTRLACGSCHDNLFFDTGRLSPPRDFGRPYANGVPSACGVNPDCAGFGGLATCNLGSGRCERTSHPVQPDDMLCGSCHGDSTSTSPIAARHDVPQRTQGDGVTLSMVTVSGGSRANGTFAVGDVPVVRFRLSNKAGPVTTLASTSGPWSADVIVAGPNEAAQRVWPRIDLKAPAGALVYDAGSGLYTFTFPAPWPTTALPPLNATSGAGQVNLPGSYTLVLTVSETLRPPSPNVANRTWTDVASASATLRFSADGPKQPRQVTTKAACDSCHSRTEAHGGLRRDASQCFTCHTRGSADAPLVGSVGAPCTVANQTTACAGFASGYEACQDTNADGVPDHCVVTRDPTPNATVEFSVLMHQLHFARKLGGYAEQNNVPFAGLLELDLIDRSAGLSSQDVRNCVKCHADARGVCNALAPCGIGQSCRAGTCVNTSWTVPSGPACLSCHDTSAATAHVQLQTWIGPSGPLEACDVCHAPGRAFDVATVHALANPYLPPYARE